MNKECTEHKWVHKETSKIREMYRYSNSFYQTDFYFCEKCLEEKEVSKYWSGNDAEVRRNAPEWVKAGNFQKIDML